MAGYLLLTGMRDITIATLFNLMLECGLEIDGIDTAEQFDLYQSAGVWNIELRGPDLKGYLVDREDGIEADEVAVTKFCRRAAGNAGVVRIQGWHTAETSVFCATVTVTINSAGTTFDRHGFLVKPDNADRTPSADRSIFPQG